MGNCARKQVDADGEKVKKGKKIRSRKQKKGKSQKGSHAENGRAEELVNGHTKDEEKFNVKYVKPVGGSAPYEGGPDQQERKVLRLVLPYIPKKRWAKLREVNKTWRSVVDGEWARMRSIDLTDFMQKGVDHCSMDQEKGRLLADHLSSKCGLSKAIICTPPPHQRRRPIDLTDEEFWCLLLPRTGDLTTIKLHNVHLPKYFFDVFLPKCVNLETLEILEAPGSSIPWTDADNRRLHATVNGLSKNLNNVNVSVDNQKFQIQEQRRTRPIPSGRQFKYDVGHHALAEPTHILHHQDDTKHPGLPTHILRHEDEIKRQTPGPKSHMDYPEDQHSSKGRPADKYYQPDIDYHTGVEPNNIFRHDDHKYYHEDHSKGRHTDKYSKPDIDHHTGMEPNNIYRHDDQKYPDPKYTNIENRQDPYYSPIIKDTNTAITCPVGYEPNGFSRHTDPIRRPVPKLTDQFSPQLDVGFTMEPGQQYKPYGEHTILNPGVLRSMTLPARSTVTSMSFELNIDVLDRHDTDQSIRQAFSKLPDLTHLRVNVVSNQRNVYQTLRTLALILTTVAENSKKLQNLKLIRMPDPMGIDKELATEFTTAFVKLNDETQLDHLHVCVLAPSELFHPWSLPWAALTRLQSLTITDCNMYIERPRSIDFEAMPELRKFTLCSDSLDDDMLMRVFKVPHANLVQLTLEPGPKGIGKTGMSTVAVACPNLHYLIVSLTRSKQPEFMDSRGWTMFFRAAPDSLRKVMLVDVDEQYFRDIVQPVAMQCPQVEVRPMHASMHFDTYGEQL